MKVLVTGGAGYVGSVVTEELLSRGHQAVVLDNLQQGHRAAVPPGAGLVAGDINQAAVLDEAFEKYRPEAVLHLAGETVVGYSITDPRRFFECNVAGGLNLLSAMQRHGVNRLIFSSSAAVYGEPAVTPIAEDHPTVPINSYGESKLMFERILAWYGPAYGLKYISFRYFNAAGASERLGEDHRPETHLIPNLLKAVLNQQGQAVIYGNDYPTRDGSCLRDYVHVHDIARAHIMALDRLEELSGRVYNLGTATGFSVLEVAEAVRKVTGADLPLQIEPRRAGDPAILVASAARAKTELGWEPEYAELESIIESAWHWQRRHPAGYED